METKHTPGPWSYYDASEFGAASVGDFLNAFGISSRRSDKPSTSTTFATVDGFTKQEAEANARLIASAPELLDALNALLNALPSATTHPAIKQARAAIAKATD